MFLFGAERLTLPRSLQRLDGHLAELHHARAILQRERSFLEHPVAQVDGFLAVEHDGNLPTLGGDLERVPLAAGLRHRIDLGEIDDRAGAVGRILALVEDVHLVAALGAELLRIGTADEDAAVGVVARPELGVDLEVLVLVLGDQVRRLALVGNQRAVLDPPVGFADLIPVAHGLAVDQRDPAGTALAEASGANWMAANAATTIPASKAGVRVERCCIVVSSSTRRSRFVIRLR